MPVDPIPSGYAGVTPYLVVRDALRALDFYRQALPATEVLRLTYPDGKVAHAELAIGAGHVMIAEELPGMGYKGPQTLGGAGVSMLVYVPDVDAAFARAVAAGATVSRPVADQFYGDRAGTFTDPFGHVWTLATRVKEMSAAQMQKAMEAMMQSQSQQAQ